MKVLVNDQKQIYINFKTFYHKLLFDIFPTIRGKSWFKKINIGDIRAVYVDRKHLCVAKLISKKIIQIKDIPLDFLQWDTASSLYLGPNAHPPPIQQNILSDREAFCELLNTFYPRKVYPNLKATLETEVTVLIFEKLIGNEQFTG